MKTLELICLSGAFVSCLNGCKQAGQEEHMPLNVIYILADDLGYGDIGCYGQKLIKTPHLDEMASQGMLFTQYYAGCTVSAPSRASLMTGLHTGHTLIRGNKGVKPEGQMPMPEGTYSLGKLFQSCGYATGVFGKWGLGFPGSSSEPGKMGFDEFYGYNCQSLAHSYYPDYLWHNQAKVVFPENVDNGRKTYSHDLIHRQALQFIKDHRSQPFFAMLTYTLPHAEMNLPHDSIYQLYEDKFEEQPYDKPGSYYRSEKPHASFAAMVSRLDMYVGDILAELKRLGLDKNTVVFFTSDNGPHQEGGADPAFFNSSGPLRGIKRDLYEGGIRVPLVVWAPKLVKAGSSSDHVCAFWDMMPTFAELIGGTIPEKGDGISFLPTLLSKEGQKKHDYLYWEFHEQGGRQAIRKGNWKLIRQGISSPNGSWLELYNLKEDVHEDTNLIEKQENIAMELDKLMNQVRVQSEIFNFGK